MMSHAKHARAILLSTVSLALKTNTDSISPRLTKHALATKRMGTSKMEQTQFVENATCLANHATEEHHPTVLLVAAMLPKSQAYANAIVDTTKILLPSFASHATALVQLVLAQILEAALIASPIELSP